MRTLQLNSVAAAGETHTQGVVIRFITTPKHI